MPMGVYVPDKAAPTILSKGGVYPVLVPRNTVGSTQHLLFLRNIRCFGATPYHWLTLFLCNMGMGYAIYAWVYARCA